VTRRHAGGYAKGEPLCSLFFLLPVFRTENLFFGEMFKVQDVVRTADFQQSD